MRKKLLVAVVLVLLALVLALFFPGGVGKTGQGLMEPLKDAAEVPEQ
jgi:hypothetical protein